MIQVKTKVNDSHFQFIFPTLLLEYAETRIEYSLIWFNYELVLIYDSEDGEKEGRDEEA